MHSTNLLFICCAAAVPANPEDIELDEVGDEDEDAGAVDAGGVQLEQKAVPVRACSALWLMLQDSILSGAQGH